MLLEQMSLFFFVSACVTYSLMERLTMLVGNKDKNPGKEKAQK